MKIPCPCCTELHEYRPDEIVTCHYCKREIRMFSLGELSEEERQQYCDEQLRLRLRIERRKARKEFLQEMRVKLQALFESIHAYFARAIREAQQEYEANQQELRRAAKERQAERLANEQENESPQEAASGPPLAFLFISFVVVGIPIILCSGLLSEAFLNAPSHRSTYDSTMSYEEFREGNELLDEWNAQGYSDEEISRAIDNELRRRGEY